MGLSDQPQPHPGHCSRHYLRHDPSAAAFTPGKQRGFTLLELLVVLAIMALALGAAVLALRDPAQVALAQEGQRLAAWLETGRATARSSGQTVRWRATDTGFELAGGPQPIPPQPWLNARTTVVAVSVAGAAPVPAPPGAWLLVLGPEPILPAQSLLLSLEGHSLRVASDGLSPFAVQVGQVGQVAQVAP